MIANLFRNDLVERAGELDGAAGYVHGQLLEEIGAEEDHADGDRIGDVQRVDVVVEADGAARVHQYERVVEALLGRLAKHVHALEVSVHL